MLNKFEKLKSSVKKRKRVGRGNSSGFGKTCGSGHKGQKARKGVSINGFEGGQMPIYRRVPKRGFNNPFTKTYQIVKISQLNKLLESSCVNSGDKITNQVLYENGLISCLVTPIKYLGGEQLSKPLDVIANKFTQSAIKSIENSSGTVVVN